MYRTLAIFFCIRSLFISRLSLSISILEWPATGHSRTVLPDFVLNLRGGMARYSNKEIVRQLKEGDPRGCRHLVEAYQDRLLGEATDVFGVSVEDAEELVNDVLLIAVTRIGSFEFKKSEADFYLWLITIFRNRVRDFVRKRAICDGLREVFDESEFDAEKEYSTTELEVLREIVREYVRSVQEEDGQWDAKLTFVADVLDRMETWERVLLRCRALDVPYEEISHYTGKTPSQLKVYHARVKRKFVKMLAERHPEFVNHEA